MRDGADADDAWRLVEDEFEVTARLFTRHLHHAEYQRQKQLAKRRNQGAVDAITGPASGKTDPSAQSPRPRQGAVQAERSKKVIYDVRDEANGKGDDPWLRDPRLAGLMSHKQNRTPLAKIDAMHSTSRAAHGFSKGQSSPPKRRKYAPSLSIQPEEGVSKIPRQVSFEQDDDDSDDLDAPSYRAPAPLQSQTSRSTKPFLPPGNTTTAVDKIHALSSSEFRLNAKCLAGSPGKTISASEVDLAEDGEGDADLFDPFSLRRNRPLESKVSAKSQALMKHEKDDDEKRKRPLRAEEIPTFLV